MCVYSRSEYNVAHVYENIEMYVCVCVCVCVHVVLLTDIFYNNNIIIYTRGERARGFETTSWTGSIDHWVIYVIIYLTSSGGVKGLDFGIQRIAIPAARVIRGGTSRYTTRSRIQRVNNTMIILSCTTYIL